MINNNEFDDVEWIDVDDIEEDDKETTPLLELDNSKIPVIDSITD